MTKSNDRNFSLVVVDGITFSRGTTTTGAHSYARHNADGTNDSIINIAPICDRIDREIMEAAHAEALAIDAASEVLESTPVSDEQAYAMIARHKFEALDLFAQWNVVDAAHAEALEMNAAIDHMIDEREHVSNCEYDPIQESARLARLGRGNVMNYPEHFGEAVFVKLKHLALRLWGNGFVTYPVEEAGADYIAACIDCRAQWVHFA